jgi:hypothetical protein
MRIVALADSLALPRDREPDVLRWQETWPYVLEKDLLAAGLPAEVINCGGRARTVDTLLGADFREHVYLKRPQVLVLQVGIVDCAPRVLSRREKRLLNQPFVPAPLRRAVIRWRASRRGEITARNPLSRVYTRPRAFSAHLDRFRHRLGQLDWKIHLIVLPIVSNPLFMEKKSPGHTANVALYNRLLESFARDAAALWFEPAQLFPENIAARSFCADGYHLNVSGSQRLAAVLAEHLLRAGLTFHPLQSIVSTVPAGAPGAGV